MKIQKLILTYHKKIFKIIKQILLYKNLLFIIKKINFHKFKIIINKTKLKKQSNNIKMFYKVIKFIKITKNHLNNNKLINKLYKIKYNKKANT